MIERKSKDISSIISSIKDGDERVFEFFFKAEYSGLRYFLYNYIRDSNVVEDIIQDSFLTIWKQRESLDFSKNIRAFLYTIARNKTLNIIREKSRYSSNPIEEMESHFFIKSLSNDIMISKIDALEMEEIINKAYGILPEKVKEIFLLSRKQGLTYDQIAAKRGISVKTVERSISRALVIFRKKLSRYITLLLLFYGG